MVGNEFQVLVARIKKECMLVGLAGLKEIWLPLEGLVVLVCVTTSCREDIMGHVDQAVHRFEEEYYKSRYSCR